MDLTSTTQFSVALVSTAVILAWVPLIRLRGRVRFTTLGGAAGWAGAAAGLWTAAWTLDHGLHLLAVPVADHLWYFCAVAALCPAIAVLGARRPGTRVWNGFILVPLLFALGWPVIALLAQGRHVRGLQLETPQLAVYLLVLVMGAGNYVGTRHTVAALLYTAANALVVVSSSAACPSWLADRWWSRLCASGGMAAAVLIAGRAGSAPASRVRFDRLWLDFFDQFGVVWGRRIQDRVNFIAGKESWAARLQLHGLEWSAPPDSATEARIEHTFRWLLRRFVDPAWIDERLGTSSTGQESTALGADS